MFYWPGYPQHGWFYNFSYVRLLHASPNAPAVDVFANNITIARNLRYKEFTQYLPIFPGRYRVRVFPSGQHQRPVLETTVNIPPRSIFTGAVTGLLPDINLLPVPEPPMPTVLRRAYLRVVHLSPNAPAVDVVLPDGTKVFRNVSYEEITDYRPVRKGTYTFEVRPAGTNKTVLTIRDVRLDSRRFYTIFVVGLAGKRPPLEALLSIDANTYIKF